jgi:hypothetical protein
MNKKKECKYCKVKDEERISRHFGIDHCDKNDCAKKLYEDSERKLKYEKNH